MISCTEFIPMYSHLFTFIEKKSGYDAVVKYWENIRDKYTRPMLGAIAKEEGVAACWDYWSMTLNEEAADFRMTYDDETGVYEAEMRYCPSRGRLEEMKHVTPFHDYCGHCRVLYAPILEENGAVCDNNFEYTGTASCKWAFHGEPKPVKNP